MLKWAWAGERCAFEGRGSVVDTSKAVEPQWCPDGMQV